MIIIKAMEWDIGFVSSFAFDRIEKTFSSNSFLNDHKYLPHSN